MAKELIDRTPEDWKRILIGCGVKKATAERWAQAFADEVTADKFSAGESELDDFLGQILHESGMLEYMTENLNYSADRIRQLARASGPGTRWYSLLDRADELARNPEGFANALYSNRMGNGDEASGDGYRYRGRCPIGLTFKDNYEWIGDRIGNDLVSMPELIEQPHFALQATVDFWEGRVPDSALGDIIKVTKRINGGTIGIADRQAITSKARMVLDRLRNA